MRIDRWVALICIMFAFAATFSTAYGYGIQNHTVNGIQHGCNDSGCFGSTNYAGDYNKEGFNLFMGGLMNGSWVSVHDYAGNQYSFDLCSGCTYASAFYDSNPYWECAYKTLHGVDSPFLNYNDHYTESAIC